MQGVGFRPFVYTLATELGLVGSVLNDSQGLLIEAQGERLDELIQALRERPPPLAVVDSVSVRMLPACEREAGFSILASHEQTARTTLVSPDVATCDDCLRELADPADRRYRYPFLNCTNCGPRYTIVRDVPYDRPNTTMAGFPMCADCLREYHDPSDRRFHAQPVACPACGPRLALVDGQRREVAGDPLEVTVERLRQGQVVAIKGLGGYHLAALATHGEAVATLRRRKHREARPFALMVRDLASARALADVGGAEEALLTGKERPIVLLTRRDSGLAKEVAPGQPDLGIMLPYTPVHHLLLSLLDAPLVLTSGNVSDEPIAYRDDEALERLGSIADLFLTHNRPIHIRTDDSVMRCFRNAPMPLRRSRGYVPRPLRLPWDCPRPVLGCGAELKSTVCLLRGRQALLSHHLGDLENLETYQSFQQAVEHLQGLFGVRAGVVAHDLHPEYLSTRWARDFDGELVPVQHHHAHIAACLADNGEDGPVTGVAFDGLGYGTDGTLWGGEFLLADRAGFRRLGSLAPVALPSGGAAIREPWRMAAAYLGLDFPELPLVTRHPHWALMARLSGLPTSSMGRLFDAVAAILDLGDRVDFEGQAAIALEQLADPLVRDGYPVTFAENDGQFRALGPELVRCVVADKLAGLPPSRIAGRFHNSIVDLVVEGCRRAGLPTVALSGGVFQNMLLLDRTVERLEGCGFRVLVHRRVPANDGGLSLGQAVIAGARQL